MNYDDLTCPYRDKNINVFSLIEKIKKWLYNATKAKRNQNE